MMQYLGVGVSYPRTKMSVPVHPKRIVSTRQWCRHSKHDMHWKDPRGKTDELVPPFSADSP